jgi:hypothetical protein
MERFLYRHANSSVVDRFVLKGALLLTAWQAPLSRPTMDIDLAARTSNELDHISEVVRSGYNVRTEPDGIEFDPTSIEIARIKEGAEYEGVRVTFTATLARARIPMQIDIGFGDVIVPAATPVDYPTLLDFPACAACLPKGNRCCREIGGAHQTRIAEQPIERLLRSRSSLTPVFV